jgi:hypothetical protein
MVDVSKLTGDFDFGVSAGEGPHVTGRNGVESWADHQRAGAIDVAPLLAALAHRGRETFGELPSAKETLADNGAAGRVRINTVRYVNFNQAAMEFACVSRQRRRDNNVSGLVDVAGFIAFRETIQRVGILALWNPYETDSLTRNTDRRERDKQQSESH